MDVLSLTDEQFTARLCSHISIIYQDIDSDSLAKEIIAVFEENKSNAILNDADNSQASWNEQDIYLITYADSIVSNNEKPLRTLNKFLMKYMRGVINTVHILPFFPYSSDDGFAVIDYKKVKPEVGDWSDITYISKQFKLMADLVINHISSKSDWFQQYIKGEKPGCEYFIEASPDDNLTKVVRPRTSPLLLEVETISVNKFVWCTFGHDQIDVDFSNPDVLLEYVSILHFYLTKGIKVIRMDAVAFIWKKIGTSCINLPETHEIVKLLRLVVERYFPNTVFITETNVPNLENLKYFGNANEAHVIYNFSLPPLLLHALWKGNAEHLSRWSMTLPPAPVGCTYLNFTASHDGIGLRPVEGILPENEIDDLVADMHKFGAESTSRAISGTAERPYEINITWFEAMKGDSQGADLWQFERFLCSQIVMLGLEGIPAFYLHSFLAAENDSENFAKTHHKRALNRKKWSLEQAEARINDFSTVSSKVFFELKRLISIRAKQAAFHPNSTQFTLKLGPSIFGFWRQSMDRTQSIFAIHNVTASEQELYLSNINLICTDTWVDLIAWDVLDLSANKVILKPYQCLWITNRG